MSRKTSSQQNPVRFYWGTVVPTITGADLWQHGWLLTNAETIHVQSDIEELTRYYEQGSSGRQEGEETPKHTHLVPGTQVR
jgi:hypothetical protein